MITKTGLGLFVLNMAYVDFILCSLSCWKCVAGCWYSDVNGINETMAAIMNPLSTISDRLASA